MEKNITELLDTELLDDDLDNLVVDDDFNSRYLLNRYLDRTPINESHSSTPINESHNSTTINKWFRYKFWNQSSDELLEYFYTLSKSDKIRFIDFVIKHEKLELFIKILQSENMDLEYDNNLFFKSAIRSQSYDIFHYLLNNGINVAAENNFIIKNLFLNVNFSFIKMLIDRGADIKSVLHMLPQLCGSTISYQLEKIKYLIDSGADIHQNNDQPLLVAVAYGNDDIAIYLIENGADVHADNDYALRFSVRHRNIKMVEYLLKAGADVTKISLPDIMNCLRYDMLSMPNKIHMSEILQLLISYGMDISFINSIDLSSLDSNNVIKLLITNGIDPITIANIMALALLHGDVYKKFIK